MPVFVSSYPFYLTEDVTDFASDLYGSDLEQRAEYEGYMVPTVVTRCIEEVEERGKHLLSLCFPS